MSSGNKTDDGRWVKLVADVVEGCDCEFGEVIDRLRKNDWYQLAHAQFVGGATPRVVARLLRRAMIETGIQTE